MFRAVLIEKTEGGQSAALQTLDDSRLPEGDVTVRVAYSTLNYKDALALTGKAPVVRKYPMVPGIDFSGTVEASSHPDFKPGDVVLLNGWGVGENHWGGLAERVRVPGQWLLPLQAPFTLRQAMGVGTAGYTAALCVQALLRQGLKPEQGPVLVTGAAGGVGSIAVVLLSRLGFEVVASTGRPQEAEFLKGLGAQHVLDRAELDRPSKPLEKERWAGAVDVVGGQVLASVCAGMKYRGVVAACGLAAGMNWPATVVPFILRAVVLAGVESVVVPTPQRLEAWRLLAEHLPLDLLERLMQDVTLDEVFEVAPRILAGQVRGRVVVGVQPTP